MPKPINSPLKGTFSNTLFYGDNPPILCEHFSSAFGTFKQAEKVKKKEGSRESWEYNKTEKL